MQKLYTILLAIGVANVANAQFTPGQKLVGPSFSLNASNSTNFQNQGRPSQSENKYQSFFSSIGVSSIKMKKKNIGFGFGASYGIGLSKNTYTQLNAITQSNKRNTHNIGITGFRRQYIPIKEKFNFFFDAGVGLGYSFTNTKDDYITNNQERKESEYSLSVFATPGLSYAIKKNLLLEASMPSLLAARVAHTVTKNNVGSQNYKNNATGFSVNSAFNNYDFLRNLSFSLRWIM